MSVTIENGTVFTHGIFSIKGETINRSLVAFVLYIPTFDINVLFIQLLYLLPHSI